MINRPKVKKFAIVITLLTAFTIAGLFAADNLIGFNDYSENRPVYNGPKTAPNNAFSVSNSQNEALNNPRANEQTSAMLPQIPEKKYLANDYHIYQTFNNCGPASLSMALSYFGINQSQAALGNDLRPFQNPQGDNDDKSVTLEELADKAEEFGLTAYHRPAGTMQKLQNFIAMGVPVITRTWLKVDDDIGHYRVIKGYDRNREVLIQDDSLQGQDLEYSFSEFNAIWEKFNYEYLVLVEEQDIETAELILGDHADPQKAWEDAVANSQNKLKNDPDNVTALFNLSVALYHTGNYQDSVDIFETVQDRLSKRTLWYQIEPLLAYYELGQYQKIFTVSNNILGNGNRAFSELYILRGDIYYEQGNTDLAREEYQKAVQYNTNMEEARQALDKVT